MSDRPTLSVVMPAYNERATIHEALRRVLDAPVDSIEIVVVDDGSTDGTADAARATGATVLEQRPNAGKGAALRLGFRRALDDGAEAILTLDADGQHDPAEIPRFLAAWKGAAPPPDLVIGRRDFRAMPPIRRLSNELGRRAFSWAVGQDVADNQSGYRLVSARLASRTLESAETGFALEVEQITTCIRMGGAIAWVPIRTIYAGAPSHIRPLAHLREFIRIVRRARRDVRRPLD